MEAHFVALSSFSLNTYQCMKHSDDGKDKTVKFISRCGSKDVKANDLMQLVGFLFRLFSSFAHFH